MQNANPMIVPLPIVDDAAVGDIAKSECVRRGRRQQSALPVVMQKAAARMCIAEHSKVRIKSPVFASYNRAKFSKPATATVLPVGSNCHALDGGIVLAEFTNQGAAGSVPQMNFPIISGRGQPFSVRTISDRPNPVGMTARLNWPTFRRRCSRG